MQQTAITSRFFVQQKNSAIQPLEKYAQKK